MSRRGEGRALSVRSGATTQTRRIVGTHLGQARGVFQVGGEGVEWGARRE